MMSVAQLRQKIEAAVKVLNGESTTFDKLESALALVKGANPNIDKKLDRVLFHLSNLRNLQEGDVVELTLANLPERDEKEKKRKKAILFLLRSIRELRSEIERVQKELSREERGEQTSTQTLGNTFAFAKGPFGIITLVAVGVVVAALFLNRGQSQKSTAISVFPTPSPVVATPSPAPATASPRVSPSPVSGGKVKVITFDGKKVPLSQLEVLTGPDCTNSPSEAPHYHAANGQYVTSVDGTQINDPGGCAFGKVSETAVEEISPSNDASQVQFERTVF